MLKPLTLSLSLALALGACSVSMAGLHDGGCSTCGLASPQGVVPSAQYVGCGGGGCGGGCGGHRFHMPHFSLPKRCTTYEWVLRKKHTWVHAPKPTCNTCAGPIYPSAQYASPQAYGAPQAYSAPQAALAPTSGTLSSAPAPVGDEAPPAPEVAPPPPPANAPQSSLLFSTPSGN
jgi:hypothetical protein